MNASNETNIIYLPLQDQKDLLGADTFFEDYRSFKRPGTAERNQEFIDGVEYVPAHDYPALRELHGGASDVARRKREASRAIMELEANKASSELKAPEYELAAAYHEKQLRKLLLAEEAKNLHDSGSSSAQDTARNAFEKYNKELYGEVDRADFSAMMNTEQARVREFVPKTAEAQRIHQQLLEYFNGIEFGGEEHELMSQEDLAELRRALLERFGDILDAVPETEDSKKHDAEQIANMFRGALSLRGFTEKGWIVRVEANASVTDTDAKNKEIVLPASLSRTAREIRRLMIHEFSVHALRGQNGAETGIAALGTGTANYGDVEEGEGVLFECALEGNFDNASFYRARDRYIVAGLALGVDGGENQDSRRDARQVFELTWRLFAVRFAEDGNIDESVIAKAQAEAMTHVDNAFRSTNFAGRGVIYRKLKMYYEGLKKNAKYYERHRDNMGAAVDASLVGKFDHTDEEEGGEAQTVRELAAA